MTLKQIAITGADGAAATTANTGATTIVSSGSSTITIQSSAPYKSFKSLRFAGDGTNASYANWNFVADASSGAVSVAFEVPPAPFATDFGFATIYDAANTRTIQLIYRSNGEVATADFSGAYHRLLTAAQAVAGTWFRFEIVVNTMSSTTATWHVTTFSAADAAISGGSYTATGTGNTGTNGNLHQLRTGVLVASTNTVRMAAIQLDDGRSTEIGPMTVSIGNPSVSVTPYGPAYRFDAASNSSVGTGSSGSMSFTAAHLSGPTNTIWEPSDGIFDILQDTTTDAVWTITGTDSGTGRTASANVTVPAIPAATSTTNTSLTETVTLSGGVWA